MERTEIKVTATHPKGELGIFTVDERGRRTDFWFSKPSTSKVLDKEDFERAVNESMGMKKIIEKGYIKISEEDVKKMQENYGVEEVKTSLTDMEIKVLLKKNKAEFKAELEKLSPSTLERVGRIMAEEKNLEKAELVEKYLSFKVADLIAQTELDKE